MQTYTTEYIAWENDIPIEDLEAGIAVSHGNPATLEEWQALKEHEGQVLHQTQDYCPLTKLDKMWDPSPRWTQCSSFRPQARGNRNMHSHPEFQTRINVENYWLAESTIRVDLAAGMATTSFELVTQQQTGAPISQWQLRFGKAEYDHLLYQYWVCMQMLQMSQDMKKYLTGYMIIMHCTPENGSFVVNCKTYQDPQQWIKHKIHDRFLQYESK